MPRHLLPSLLWVLLCLWALGIFGISSIPGDKMIESKWLMWDKFNHFIAFSVGGWLAASAMRASLPQRKWGSFFAAVVLVSLYGLLDELHQLFTPGRQGADLNDWIADILGTMAGATLALITYVHLNRLVPRP